MVGQPRSTQRYNSNSKTDEQTLRSNIIQLATRYGRYGYRPPAPEAVQPLIFELFWFTSGRENMLGILT